MVATVERSGPTYTFNMNPAPIKAHDESLLAPYRGSKRDIRANFTKQGHGATIDFDVPFGQNRKFLRGVTKIAFSSLAFFLGAPLARSSAFTPIRYYVQQGVGNRHILLTADSNTTYSNRVWQPYVSASGEYVVTFRIAFVEFLVDLSEKESFLSILQSKATETMGENHWCTLPIEA